MSLNQSLVGLACQVSDLMSQCIRPILAHRGITNAEFALLSAVKVADGRETQADIGRRLGLSRATISESVSAMVTNDVMRRVMSTTDRRTMLLELTPSGHQQLNAVLRDIKVVEQKLIKKLMVRESQTTARVLKRLSFEIEKLLDSRGSE